MAGRNNQRPPTVEPVPVPLEREETGPMTVRLLDAAAGAAPPAKSHIGLDELAELLHAAREAMGGGEGGGRAAKSQTRRHVGLTAIVALLASLGTGFAGYKVLQATVARNEQEIAAHETLPMHPATASEFAKVETELGQVRTGQAKIADGIDELKRENIDRLKHELERAEAELRRRRRDR